MSIWRFSAIKSSHGYSPIILKGILYSSKMGLPHTHKKGRKNGSSLDKRNVAPTDLNALDYSMWANVKKDACKASHTLVEALKVSMTNIWQKMAAAVFGVHALPLEVV